MLHGKSVHAPISEQHCQNSLNLCANRQETLTCKNVSHSSKEPVNPVEDGTLAVTRMTSEGSDQRLQQHMDTLQTNSLIEVIASDNSS